MRVKTGKPIRITFLYGFIITIMFLTVVTASSESEGKKEQPHRPSIIITGQLRFIPSGAPGEYREVEPVVLKIHQSVKCLRFSVSSFLYSGDSNKGKFVLNTTYWIDNPRQCFDSRMPLVLHTGASKKSGEPGYFELRLYGKVTIDQVSAQPAGEYGGNVMVTVTERL